jgi:UDP-N-acetylglucosamine--N-acetylmuramyl-(pentapeptide) pyrophosphoryl-undecaprenol N-acetylglucosamine transferase
MGVKTYIHEQNAFPGATNKLAERSVEKIFLGFEEAAIHFKHKEKLVSTGNPVRREFENLDKRNCREKLGIGENMFMILAFGGSGGAGRLNNEIMNVVKTFSEEPEVAIFFATGRVYYKQVMEKMKGSGMNPSGTLQILEYIEKMHLYMGAADLVIGRAGALTLAEITLCGKASILIPSPNVTGNHQYYNAKAVSDRGGAILIEEKDLDENKVVEVVRRLMADKDCLERMMAASRGCAHQQAVEKIYEAITSDFKGFSWGKNDIGSNRPG